MRPAVKYFYRIMAALYLLLFALMLARNVYIQPEDPPISWDSALRAFGVLAVGVWLGWWAGRESKGAQR